MKYLLLCLVLFSSVAQAAGTAIATGKFGRPTPSFFVDVAKGAVAGHRLVNVVGHAPIGTTYQLLWDCTTTDYTWPTTALAMSIVSTDANDAVAGTGVRTVTVYGLDANWAEQTVTVTMNGLTPVAITGTWLRINKIIATTAGSNEGAVGTITVSNGGTTYSCLVNGYNTSVAGYYTIPTGYYGLLLQGAASAEAGKSVELDFYARPFSQLFRLAHHVHLYQNFYQYNFKAIQVLPPKSDIILKAVSTAAGSEASASFDLLLVREDLISVQ